MSKDEKVPGHHMVPDREFKDPGWRSRSFCPYCDEGRHRIRMHKAATMTSPDKKRVWEVWQCGQCGAQAEFREWSKMVLIFPIEEVERVRKWKQG